MMQSIKHPFIFISINYINKFFICLILTGTHLGDLFRDKKVNEL